MKLRGIGKSDPGLKHVLNEDRFLLAPELGLYVVADGMGGHKGGELASGMVVETMADYWKSMKEGRPPALLPSIAEDLSEQGKHLVNSILMSNLVIHEFQKKARYHRMGSTVSAILQEKDFLWIANVGDSPVFLFDRGRLLRISEEHSVAEEQRAMGISEPPGAFNPLLKNILTRALGLGEKVKVYANSIRPDPGDFILMSSDGLTKFVPEPSIKTILDDPSASIERKVDALIHEANQGGGGDNITAILLEVQEEGRWFRFKQRMNRKGPA
ncbi:MAG: protein phosphatase 2C domain-containing protein [Desulfatiglandales bacterium]